MNELAVRHSAERHGTDAPLMSVRNLRVEFFSGIGSTVAVPDLSFDIARGESYGLVGESGCGKTTTAMAIMSYLGVGGRVTGGEILFEGRDLVQASARDMSAIRGGRIAMVYQEPMTALNPTMSIGEQLAEVPMCHQGASRRQALDRAAAMLEEVRIPDVRQVLKRFPHQLSGGQQQRVVIAMALLAEPALLILDEPTTGLDVTVEAAVLDLIGDLRARHGTSLLFISHNLGLIASSCDRVGIMYSGLMVEEQPVDSLFAQPLHPYTQGLIGCIPDMRSSKHSRRLTPIPGHIPLPSERPRGCVFAPRCAHSVPGRCDALPVPLLVPDAGRSVRCVRWNEIERPMPLPEVSGMDRRPPADDGSGLVVDRLSKVYEFGGLRRQRLTANEDLTFAATKGDILAIVGESGCGKSTFARILAGLDKATSGSIVFDGRSLTAARRRSRDLLQAVQMVFQNPDSTLNPSHSVGWPIRRAISNFGAARGKDAVGKRLRELFELVHLPVQFERKLPRVLSGGQKQRVAIARAFAGNASLVVADEPVSALDVSVQAAIVALLLDIQKRNNTTLVFISHDLALVRHMADRVVVMYLGRVVEQGTTEEVFSPPYHPYTEALLSAVHGLVAEGGPRPRIRLSRETPAPSQPAGGCCFASRCPRKLGRICDAERPPTRRVSSSHQIECHIPLDDLQRNCADRAI